MPIRTYSAGMQTRLAFSISTNIEPDILLLDEGIAAGDTAIMNKANKHCMNWSTERASSFCIALGRASSTLLLEGFAS